MDVDATPLIVLAVVGVMAAFMATWVALFLVARRFPPGLLRQALRAIPAAVGAARRLSREPIPFKAKAAVVFAVIWVVSPLDPVPDFLPVIGLIDEVIVILATVRYSARQIGEERVRAAWRGDEQILDRLLED